MRYLSLYVIMTHMGNFFNNSFSVKKLIAEEGLSMKEAVEKEAVEKQLVPTEVIKVLTEEEKLVASFFEDSFKNDLKKLVDLDRLSEEDRIVVMYRLSGLDSAMIMRIAGKSFQQMIQIVKSVFAELDSLKQSRKVGDKESEQKEQSREPISITLQACALTEEEFFVLKCRLEEPPMVHKAIASVLKVKTEKTFSEVKIKELEKTALEKLRHPIYKLLKKDLRGGKA